MDQADTLKNHIEFLRQSFEDQYTSFQESGYSSYPLRKNRLQKLLAAIERHRPQLKESVYLDFRKNPTEVDITEILPTISELSHAIKSIRHWMRKKRVDRPITLLGTKNWIRYEPKGVVLIVSPFNFPILLSLGPLISAIASGNHAILKPSELTPNTNKVLSQLISETFPPQLVQVIEGNSKTAKELVKLPFNHIFFTGSTKVGRLVMEAAAKNLTPVTLELGGKSPAIVDSSANIKQAAQRIAWSKYINGGQLCVAPDYVFVHKKVKQALVDALQSAIRQLFPEEPSRNKDFARVINPASCRRLIKYLDTLSQEDEAQIIGGIYNLVDNYIEPTLVVDPPLNHRILKEEIFGPILPVVGFNRIEDVVHLLKAKEKPLSLYIYSKNKRTIQYLLKYTSSGNVAINHSAIQFFNPYLPFGGIGQSGMGKAHGFNSFKMFSNAKGVLKQNWAYSVANPLMPPYSSFTQKMVNAVIKLTKWI